MKHILTFVIAAFAFAASAGVLREETFVGDDVLAPVVGEALVLPWFDGGQMRVEILDRDISPGGVVVFSGRTFDSAYRNVVVVKRVDCMSATITDAHTGNRISVRQSGGQWVLREDAAARSGRCGAGPRGRDKRTPAGKTLLGAPKLTGDPLVDGKAMLKGETTTNRVDILVAFDKSAAQWVADKSIFATNDATTIETAIENFAVDCIANCNLVLQNTDLDRLFKFSLAGYIVVDEDLSLNRDDDGYVDSDYILEGLVNDETNHFYEAAYKQIRAKREEVHADVTSLLVSCGDDDPSGTVGIGIGLDDDLITEADFGDIAYNVCLVESVANSSTMAHEIGHNMGAGHAEMFDKDNSGPQLYDYSTGKYFNVTNAEGNVIMHAASVMAYDSDGYDELFDPDEGEYRWGKAPDYIFPGTAYAWNNGLFTETPFFSSSSHTYKYVDDDADLIDTGVLTGDETHDNTRLLSLTYPLVANYRARNKTTLTLADLTFHAKDISGGGQFTPGETVVLKAVAASGYYFAGWFFDEEFTQPVATADRADHRNASVKFPIPEGEPTNIVIYANFVDKDADFVNVASGCSFTTGEDGSFELDVNTLVESGTLPSIAVSGLPAGLKYDSKTGFISGSATKPGTYTATISAKNVNIKTAKKGTFTITVPNISCAALPNLSPAADAYIVETGIAVGGDFIDCTPEEGWTVRAAGLPSGLKFDAKTSTISGVPTKTGTYTVTFTATKKGEKTAVATITVNVAPIASSAVGAFTGFVVDPENAAKNAGVFQFTSTAAGKLTAKCSLASGAQSFTLAGWTKTVDGTYQATLSNKAATLSVALDPDAGWASHQISGTLALGGASYPVTAQLNAFSKSWQFVAVANDNGGWDLAYTDDAKAANATVSLKADGTTTLAATFGKTRVSATGQADVSQLADGVILADFAPIVTIDKAKTVLTVKTRLAFDKPASTGSVIK